MSYTPTTWANEAPSETPVKYQIVDDVSGEIAGSATIDLVTSVTAGTPLNSTNLNKIEQGITDAHDLIALGVPDIFAAKGDLAAASGADAASRLAVGANGRVLMADSAQALGLTWALETLLDLIAAKGDLLVGTAADTGARLAVGANELVLVADSGQTAGVKWSYPSLPTTSLYRTTSQAFSSTAMAIWQAALTEHAEASWEAGTNPSRITFPNGGWFQIVYSIYTQNSLDNNLTLLIKNGSTGLGIGPSQASIGGTNYIANYFGAHQFAAGEYVEVQMSESAANNLQAAYSKFQAIKIGA